MWADPQKTVDLFTSLMENFVLGQWYATFRKTETETTVMAVKSYLRAKYAYTHILKMKNICLHCFQNLLCQINPFMHVEKWPSILSKYCEALTASIFGHLSILYIKQGERFKSFFLPPILFDLGPGSFLRCDT